MSYLFSLRPFVQCVNSPVTLPLAHGLRAGLWMRRLEGVE